MDAKRLALLAFTFASFACAVWGEDPKGNSAGPPSRIADKKLRNLADRNRSIYYKNKLEYSLETGWLPNNIPFVFDFLVGSKYNQWPLHYTLVPNILSIRWQLDDIWGWGPFRGNTDFTFSGSYTAVARGPESRYFPSITASAETSFSPTGASYRTLKRAAAWATSMPKSRMAFYMPRGR